MKYTIEGFSQEYAITLRKNVFSNGKEKLIKIDCTDLVILRWFVDFYPNMKKVNVGGKEYAWLTHKKLLDDLPIVDINKRSFIDRMQKLVEFGILEYQLIKDGGTFSLYGFGENYNRMISSNTGMQSNDIGYAIEQHRGMQSNDTPVCSQTDNKDTSITDTSINNSSNKDKYKDIIDYLNFKAGTSFRSTSKATQTLIHARLADGFTLDDFKMVIDKKCAEWIGTDFAQYLRPATLFGTKFEGYLNAPMQTRSANTMQPNNKAANGNVFLSIAQEEGIL